MLRLVALAVALALAGVGAGPAAAKPAGARAHAAKYAKSARCDTQRRAATKRSPRTRRARTARCSDRLHRKVASWPALRAPSSRPPASLDAAPVAGAPVAPPAPPAPGAPAAPATPPPPPPASTLGVGAWDIDGFLLRLTRTSVPAGRLTVFFRNNDVSDHNLWIESPAGDAEQISDTVGEGGGAARTLAVGAGAWRLFCSLPDHGAMTRTLTVTP